MSTSRARVFDSDDARQTSSPWFLLAALAVAILLQLLGFRVLEPLSFDSQEYLALSQSLATGNGYAAPAGLNGFTSFAGESPTRMRQPGYPVFLLVFYWLGRRSVTDVRMIQLVLNCLTVYLVFLTGRAAFKGRFRPASILAVSLYFPWLWTSALVLSESVFIVVFAGTVYATYSLSRKRDSRLLPFGIGVLAGVLSLIRPVGFLVGGFCVVAVIVCFGFRPRLLGLLLTGGALVVLPWLARNTVELGDVTPGSTEAGYNLWRASIPSGAPTWKDSDEFRIATEQAYYIDRTANANFAEMAGRHFLEDPVGFFQRSVVRMAKTWLRFPGTGALHLQPWVSLALSSVQVAVVVLAFLGGACLRGKEVLLLLLPLAAVVASQPLAPGVTRYLLPVMPYVVLLSGQGILHRWRAS